MTMILQCKGTITDQNAPFLALYDDIESKAGSLFLWDAGLSSEHSIETGTTLENLLQAYQLASDKAFSVAVGSSAAQSALSTKQLTSKGGLHFITSQAYSGEAYSGEVFSGIRANAALRTYLAGLANPNLYVSMWTCVTRKAKGQAGKQAPLLSYAQTTSNYLMYLQSVQSQMALSGVSTSKLNKIATSDDVVGVPNYYQGNVTSKSGTGVTASTALTIGSGHYNPFSSITSLNEAPSFILYRVYIEDLSLSGRTYEQVKAIDDAEFAKAFGVGGRFYGDTWSNPSTVLP